MKFLRNRPKVILADYENNLCILKSRKQLSTFYIVDIFSDKKSEVGTYYSKDEVYAAYMKKVASYVNEDTVCKIESSIKDMISYDAAISAFVSSF